MPAAIPVQTGLHIAIAMPPSQIDIQPWQHGRMFDVEDHHAIKCKVLKKFFVLQCPNDVYGGGKASVGYKTWYRQEYRRTVSYIALQGNPRAQRVVVKTRENKNAWQKRQRFIARNLAAFQRDIEAEAQERFQELD